MVIDELGYLPFEPDAAHLFFQLVSRRYERGAMLVTSNRAVVEWGSVLGDLVVANAILDRLLLHSHVINHPRRQLSAPQKASQRPFAKGRCDASTCNRLNGYRHGGQFFVTKRGGSECRWTKPFMSCCDPAYHPNGAGKCDKIDSVALREQRQHGNIGRCG
ncbi:ATP-binding protein [Bosea sp. (in: a-proteobacteria)]|uniref:ATP-binding protein n=1 Tax=Bosea sp. (in: a-proteobacteria) TaxID=1871050 RepID=UPI003523654A